MPEKILVTIYSKPDCCLCEEAKRTIVNSPCYDQIELAEINIETDATLFARFQSEIPVIFINGRKAFKYRLTTQQFCARLRRHRAAALIKNLWRG